ncbi:SDR family NAD(P)-dependent oxidoreductase [Siminovitchia terrae]|uniref:SDR family oxidoreductase n=1 Tax=Siminovitchia terrae TaxID=1914933 RepID=A0A429X9I3_SIMTE|nr:SDR family NAD(P)-dependent oxidoreductase [Siminovitchia terrae]RST60026.1 SDR family oxidoreductase [Siminovitchia terrae]
MKKLDGQTAIVTGAARGIGKAICEKLSGEGAFVWVTDIQKDEGEKTVQEIHESGGKADFLQLDVRDADQVISTVDLIYKSSGRIDILVNNAGISGNPAPVDLMSNEEWKDLLDIHVNGSFYCLKAAAKYMKMQNYGRIINMSSLASETSLQGFAHYAAAKYAILGLTETSAKDLASYNITVNALKPGIIRSTLTDSILAVAEERISASTPLGKIGSPEDVANAACFLASPDSRFLTGISIIVDGGFRLVNEMDKVMNEMIPSSI